MKNSENLMPKKSVDSDLLRLGIPKGSLQDSTLDLFARAGYAIGGASRSYQPSVDDDRMSVVMFRAQEMSRYVEDGVLDVGLTGYDWIEENGSKVVEIAELVYAKQRFSTVRWVLAVPEEGKIRRAEDLDGGIVATELVRVTQRYFQAKGLKVKVEFSYGATEAKARLVDGIVDVTETGRSLRENGLRVLETVMTSSTRLIANPAALKTPWKRDKIENIAMLLLGAIAGRQKVGLKMNVQRKDLARISELLPAEKSPTIAPLAREGWVAVEVIVEDRVERDLVPQLKRAGASGLITYPLNKVIP
jgi:ATP phosphoribosyltransferase